MHTADVSFSTDIAIDEIVLCSKQWGYTAVEEPEALVELEALGFLTIDPTGTVFQLTDEGIDHCLNYSNGWLEADRESAGFRERTITWLSKRAYARYRGIWEKAVREACAGRIAFAMNDDGLIDRDLADALWIATPNPRVTRLPSERRPQEWVWPQVDHDRVYCAA